MTNNKFLFEIELFADGNSAGINIKCHNLAEALAQAHEFCDNHMSGRATADIWWNGDLKSLWPTTYAQGFGICEWWHAPECMDNRFYA